MRLFQPFDVPETCYIQEVAYWLAFGRHPQFLLEVDTALREPEERDDRLGYDARHYGDTLSFDRAGYSEQELSSLGIAVDFETYAKVRRVVHRSECRKNATRFRRSFRKMGYR